MMLTVKEISQITGKPERTLHRYLKHKVFKPYISRCGKRLIYHEGVLEVLKTFKPERKKVENRGGGSICWHCANACGGCSWSQALIPVKGWKAKKVKTNDYTKPSLPPPMIVIECPEFKKEERKNDSKK